MKRTIRSRKRKTLFFFLVIAGTLALGYGAFLEFHYYRDHVPWLSPIPSEPELRIRRDRFGQGDFGARRSGGRRHKGVDLLSEEGVPVVAVRSGWIRVGEVPDGMGKFVTVSHRDGYRTLYGHLSEIIVRDRSRVRQGQVIGAVGKTGNASSEIIKAHLHFEIRQGKKALNPVPFLAGESTPSG